jgi:hypothetical protein
VFTYKRGDETFVISSHGVRYYNKHGNLITPSIASIPIPEDVIASTVIELNLAGWTLVENSNVFLAEIDDATN